LEQSYDENDQDFVIKMASLKIKWSPFKNKVASYKF